MLNSQLTLSWCRRRSLSPAYVAALPCPVEEYESSFWTSKEVYETFRSRVRAVHAAGLGRVIQSSRRYAQLSTAIDVHLTNVMYTRRKQKLRSRDLSSFLCWLSLPDTALYARTPLPRFVADFRIVVSTTNPQEVDAVEFGLKPIHQTCYVPDLRGDINRIKQCCDPSVCLSHATNPKRCI